MNEFWRFIATSYALAEVMRTSPQEAARALAGVAWAWGETIVGPELVR